MRLFLTTILYFLSAASCIYSQGIFPSLKAIDFGTVKEYSNDSVKITLYNTSNNDIHVKGVSSINIYGKPAFFVRDSVFTVNEGDSIETYIYCRVLHNVYNNSEIIFHASGGSGDLKIDVRAKCIYSLAYYDVTENLSEQQLKDSLKLICGRGQISLGYNAARDSMYMVLDNEKVNGQGATDNQLHCVYTNRECKGYVNRIDLQDNYGINCEHTWPQSFFGTSGVEPMKSDMHHLFPCDGAANSTRSNHPFGVVTNPTNYLLGGSLYGGGIFEPRDGHKGKVSRVMSYFVVRYHNYGNFMDQQEASLRLWNKTFPPDSVEKRRNEDIFRMQKNRNPFVDYPQFIDRITSLSQNSVAPVITSLAYNDTLIDFGFIQSNTDIIYNYIIANTGNTNVSITGLSLSNPLILNFVYGGNDTVIEPGEAVEIGIKINLAAPNSIFEQLSFGTNIPGQNLIGVTVIANSNSTTELSGLQSIKDIINVFPNPFSQKITIRLPDNLNSSELKLLLFDISGKIIIAEKFQYASNLYDVNTANLSAGIYNINIFSNNKMLYSSQIIKH